jgi:alpha-beta hydrolase superfamily lysophospholipase
MWVRSRWPGRPILVHGYSLGTGLALHVAARQKVDLLVLEAPHAGLCRLMTRAALVPACLLPFVQRWDTSGDASKVTAPVLVLHGDEDQVIPIGEGRRLFAALPDGLGRFIAIKGGRHETLPEFPEYRRAVEGFLAQAP